MIIIQYIVEISDSNLELYINSSIINHQSVQINIWLQCFNVTNTNLSTMELHAPRYLHATHTNLSTMELNASRYLHATNDDDTQVIGSCRPRDVNALQSRMSICLDDVAAWMRSNRLQLNTSKTELLWCATARRQTQLPCTPLRVGPTWSILRQQYVTWASTSMPIYPDTHRYWKQRRSVLLLCDSQGCKRDLRLQDRDIWFQVRDDTETDKDFPETETRPLKNRSRDQDAESEIETFFETLHCTF